MFILARLLSKTLWQNYHLFLNKFPKLISKCSILQNIRISNFVILKRQPFEYEAKFEKVFLTYFFKDCTKKVLKISAVNENLKPVSLFPINGYPLNFLRNYTNVLF